MLGYETEGERTIGEREEGIAGETHLPGRTVVKGKRRCSDETGSRFLSPKCFPSPRPLLSAWHFTIATSLQVGCGVAPIYR